MSISTHPLCYFFYVPATTKPDLIHDRPRLGETVIRDRIVFRFQGLADDELHLYVSMKMVKRLFGAG